MKNRIISAMLIIQIVLCTFSATILSAAASENTVTIDDKESFIKFSKDCTLDKWSDGKIINLTCDIDFSAGEFKPVPIFGGIFNGNGHTISGVNLNQKGSYQGVFRYIDKNGRVSGLNVKGELSPGGSKSFIGGIAGENSGIIEACTFEGAVKGENVVGGIAGFNTDCGRITGCMAYGSVSGENSTGGIAGKNDGFIQNCTNNASVNTVYVEKKNTISDIETDAGSFIENSKNLKEENEEESVLGHTDTGGIVGYTSGIVQGCVNKAAIGYKHIGYNVGGIAGRQSGYMLGCENYALIQGRKDVGGIVGQAEPYILLNTSESILRNVKQELNTLNSMVNKFITDTDDLGDEAEAYLNGISDYSKDAGDNAEALLNQGTDFIDENLDEINAQAAILSNTLDKLKPVFETLENSGEYMTDGISEISEALDDIDIYAPDLSDETEKIKNALSEISKAERNLKRSISSLRNAVDYLDKAIELNNASKVQTAIIKMNTSIKEIINAKQDIKKSFADIEGIIGSKPENFEDIGINAKKIAEYLKNIGENTSTVITSLKAISESLDTIILNTEIDFSAILLAASSLKSSVRYLERASKYISSELENIGDAVEDAADKLETYTDDMSDELERTTRALSDGLLDLSYASDELVTAFEDIGDILEDLSEEKTLEFVKLGEEFRDTSKALFNSLDDISGELDGLKNLISDKRGIISGDLTAISNQFNLVINLLFDEFEELKSDDLSLSNIFVDVSDEDIENAKQGKVADCRNFGIVEADRNTGGIAGAVAVEYSKDPEDDIEKPNTFNFTYRSRAILQSCINDGKITGKKDCTGGIAGNAEIGTVYKCENYGSIESENGNYVGGIAGKSSSAVRKSYAKSKVKGKRYVGGIGGKINTLSSAYAIVNVEGDENIGTICGDCENKDNLYKSFYTDSGLGAVDGVSYSEKAEAISFDELKNIAGIPRRFISFSVTFIADGKAVGTQAIKYGDATAKIKYPEIPEKKDSYGAWIRPDVLTVTEDIEIVCEYKPYITVISSEEKNESGKLSLALCDGRFTDKAKLHIISSVQKPPAKSEENIKVYDVELLNTDFVSSDTPRLRILNENKDKTTVWILSGGKWEKVKATNNGKYTILKMNGTKSTICVKYEKRSVAFVWALLILLLILLIASAVMIKRKKFNNIVLDKNTDM